MGLIGEFDADVVMFHSFPPWIFKENLSRDAGILQLQPFQKIGPQEVLRFRI